MGPCCIHRFGQIRPVVVGKQTCVTICGFDGYCGCCGCVHQDHEMIASKKKKSGGSGCLVVVVVDLRKICSYGRIVLTEQSW